MPFFFVSLWGGASLYDTNTAVKQTTPDKEFCAIGCFFNYVTFTDTADDL